MGEHTVDPALPSWAADILLQEGGKRLAVVLLPPRRDGRRGEAEDKPCLEACRPRLFCG